MAETFTVKVEGLRALQQSLLELSSDMATKIARSATAAAAQVIKKAARRNIQSSPSIDTGSLFDAVIAKKMPKSQTTATSEHIVTVRGKSKRGKKAKGKQPIAPHAHLVEFGTVNMPAEPFLTPAFDLENARAEDAMVAKIRAGIAKAKKL